MVFSLRSRGAEIPSRISHGCERLSLHAFSLNLIILIVAKSPNARPKRSGDARDAVFSRISPPQARSCRKSFNLWVDCSSRPSEYQHRARCWRCGLLLSTNKIRDAYARSSREVRRTLRRCLRLRTDEWAVRNYCMARCFSNSLFLSFFRLIYSPRTKQILCLVEECALSKERVVATQSQYRCELGETFQV